MARKHPHFIQIFPKFSSGKPEHYMRVRAVNSNKMAVSESYVGSPSKALRAAQSMVDGLNIPEVRVDVIVHGHGAPSESLVLRRFIMRAGQEREEVQLKKK